MNRLFQSVSWRSFYLNFPGRFKFKDSLGIENHVHLSCLGCYQPECHTAPHTYPRVMHFCLTFLQVPSSFLAQQREKANCSLKTAAIKH